MEDEKILVDNNKTNDINDSERELGTKDIKSLFVHYSIVTFWGMLAQAIMVICEGIIIGNALGRSGLATISIVMPLETLNLALGTGIGLGVSSLAAIKLGDGDKEGARKCFSTVFWFTAIIMIIFSALVYINAEAIAIAFGSPESLIGECVIFIKTFMIGLPFCVLGQVIGAVLRVDEKPGIASFAMGAASLAALAILYYSVMVLKIGILGAGIYYGCTLGLSFLAIFYFLFSKSTLFKIHFSDLKIDFSMVFGSLKIAFPYIAYQLIYFIYTLVVNNLLGTDESGIHLAAFGVLNSYIVYTILIFTQTMSNGMQPIASYNYGAKRRDRLLELLKTSIGIHMVVLIALNVLVLIFAPSIIKIFAVGDEQLIETGSLVIRVYTGLSCLGFTAYFISCYYQAIEKIKKSVLMGTSRYILAIPFMFILFNMFGIMGVWCSQLIADAIAFIIAFVLVLKDMRRMKV